MRANIRATALLLAATATGLGGWAMPVSAADIALLVANVRYDSRDRVRDADRDFGGVRRAYERDGYEVITGRNVRSDQLAELLREFEDKSRDADRVVVHFAGHVEASRQNLRFVPTDMGEGSLVGADYAAPSLDLIYELLAHRPGRAAVYIATPLKDVVEAVGDGPDIPQGVLVLAGDTRTVTHFVAGQILQRDAAATAAQDTNGVTALGYVSDVAMVKREQADADDGANDDLTAAERAVAEMTAWRAAATNGSREALEGYLSAYPNGLFSAEAKARLDALTPQTSPEEQIEQALNLTRAQRRNVQKNLTLLGYDTRGVDGIFGPGTRRAIERWQKAEQFRGTGFLDRAQLRVLEAAAEARQREIDAQEEEDRAKRDQEDLAYWQATGASGKANDLRDYLRKYPDGLFSAQARRSLDAMGGADDPRAKAIEDNLNLNAQTRQLVESRLSALGFDVGRADGTFDQKTRAAIAAFQKQRRLKQTGYLDSETVGLLIVSVFSR